MESDSPHSLSLRGNLRCGFTLVELLAVIAIIGVLAALVIGGMHKVRQAARRTNSIANLRACSVAILSYAADSKGTLPNQWEGDSLGRGFIKGSLMQAYLPTPVDAAVKKPAPTWVCPVTRQALLDTGSYRESDVNLGRFVFNWLLWQRAGKAVTGSTSTITPSTPLAGVKLNSVVRPADAVLLANLSGGMRGGYGDGFANMVFVDGSVRRYRDNSSAPGAGSPATISPSVCRDYFYTVSPTGASGFRGYDW